MEKEGLLKRSFHVLFLFYTLWFCIEMISFFILLLDRLSVLPSIPVLIIILNYSFYSFHVFSAIMTIPILVDCIRRDFKTSKEKTTWVLSILFFGIFGFPLILYYWLEIKEDDEENYDDDDLLI